MSCTRYRSCLAKQALHRLQCVTASVTLVSLVHRRARRPWHCAPPCHHPHRKQAGPVSPPPHLLLDTPHHQHNRELGDPPDRAVTTLCHAPSPWQPLGGRAVHPRAVATTPLGTPAAIPSWTRAHSCSGRCCPDPCPAVARGHTQSPSSRGQATGRESSPRDLAVRLEWTAAHTAAALDSQWLWSVVGRGVDVTSWSCFPIAAATEGGAPMSPGRRAGPQVRRKAAPPS